MKFILKKPRQAISRPVSSKFVKSVSLLSTRYLICSASGNWNLIFFLSVQNRSDQIICVKSNFFVESTFNFKSLASTRNYFKNSASCLVALFYSSSSYLFYEFPILNDSGISSSTFFSCALRWWPWAFLRNSYKKSHQFSVDICYSSSFFFLRNSFKI